MSIIDITYCNIQAKSTQSMTKTFAFKPVYNNIFLLFKPMCDMFNGVSFYSTKADRVWFGGFYSSDWLF